MRLAAKHQQQHINLSDFSGGLNATTVAEMIGDKQLAEAINVELDRSTGFLRTSCGTAWIMDTSMELRAMMYDPISHWYLLVSGREVYRSNLVTYTKIGTLSGGLQPIYTPWEDGILIASGGKLQYFKGQRSLLTLAASPEVCNGVYVRGGRVFTYYDSTIRYGSIGDEETWEEDNNDDSAGKFVEAGYKDGGKIVGLVNLSQDVLIIKDNRRVYRLSGEYPNWTIREISRNIDCYNRLSFAAVTNSVLVLGSNTLQLISTTQDYGDMQAQNVAANVVNLFYELSAETTRVNFVPPLNQVWIYSGGTDVLVYDLTFNAYFLRRFDAPVLDICIDGDHVFLVRPKRITELFDQIFDDNQYCLDATPMQWSFQAKRQVSFNEYLVKRFRFTHIPLLDAFGDSVAYVGRINLPILPAAKYPQIVDDHALIYECHDLCFPADNRSEHIRQLYRNRCVDIGARGTGAMILNKIEFDIVEV